MRGGIPVWTVAGTVAISNPWDFNRDGDVDATDISLAMQNISAAGAALQLITAPNGGGAGSSVADVSPQVDSMAFGSNATGQAANQSTASSTAVHTSGSNPLLGSSLFFGSSSPSPRRRANRSTLSCCLLRRRPIVKRRFPLSPI